MAIQAIDRGTAGNPSDTFKLGQAFDTCQANDEYLDRVKPTVVETFADLATTPVTAGAVYYLKEYYSGTGLGGGKLVGKAGSTTYDNVLTFAGSGGYFERINYDCLTPQMAGSTDDATDNMAQLDALAAACSDKLVPLVQPIDEYLGVSGNFELPDNLKIYGLKLKQLTPAASTRTIFKNSGVGFIELHNVVVDRNGTADSNDPQTYTDAAGVWFQNFSGCVIDGLEVFGHGQGTGATFLTLSGKCSFKNIYVHDITWWSATTPTTEKAAGFGFQNMSLFTVDGFRVSNILSKTGTDPTRRFQTDAVDFGGCTRFTIKTGFIENVGEGIDITGSVGNDHWRIVDVYAEDCGFTSFKVANGVRYGEITGCTSVRGGWQGISIVGIASALENPPGNIYVHHNQVYDTGANPEISGGSIEYSGIAIDNRDVVAATPNNVVIHDNIIIDRNGSPNMQFGIYQYESQYVGQNIILGRNIIDGFTVKDVASQGDGSFNPSLGRYMYCAIGTTGAFSHATSGSWLKFDGNNVIDDDNDLHLAGDYTLKTDGLYTMQFNVSWVSSAAGIRGVRIKNGGTVIASNLIAAVSGDSTSQQVSVTRRFSSSDVITFEFLQSSGGSLNVNNTGTFAQIKRDEF